MKALLLPLLLAIGAGPGSRAGYELVHSAPVGTSLVTPDLRDPVTVWCAMLGRARRTADFEQFYVSGKPGESLDTVIGCMNAAARRGVKIRFLMEAKGQSFSDEPTIARVKAIPGIDFRLLDYSKVTGDGIIHAKFFVVDGQTAYVGSQNFDWRSLEHIDETGLAIDDPHAVAQLGAIFAQDWHAQAVIAGGGSPAPTNAREVTADNSGAATLVASPNAFNPPGVGDSEAELVKLLAAATREVRIEVMDYAPLDGQRHYYGVIDQAVRAAAARGVAVKLIVADWDLTPAKLPYLKSLAMLPQVEIRVATIPRAVGGFIPFARVLHTKAMTVDGAVAWVGTSNWEGGYLDHSRNVELVLRDPALVARVGALHRQLWDSAYARPLDVNADYPAPHPGRE
ncbi:phospholipase D-like domain-containing protein [Sphingomonas bacterium]|uniref:phospholipase D-like domain-containing protein n=1 Tax=Sphingomonas bacterium TaxID=1895847 RepID=UPI001C2D8B91|nr:phospholipase D-like domain-containing protein [Sphingomonas bacterium]